MWRLMQMSLWNGDGAGKELLLLLLPRPGVGGEGQDGTRSRGSPGVSGGLWGSGEGEKRPLVWKTSLAPRLQSGLVIGLKTPGHWMALNDKSKEEREAFYRGVE